MQSPREYAVTEGTLLIEQMKARRAALDMPVAEMAKALGVCVATIYHWEQGRHVPKTLKRRALRAWLESTA